MNTCAPGIAIFCSYTSPTSLYLNDTIFLTKCMQGNNYMDYIISQFK